MKKWAEKNRTAIVIFVVILIVIIFIFVVGKKEKPKKKRFLPGDIGGEIPKNWYPDDIAARLFDVIDGIDSPFKKEIEFAKANMLNDNQIISLHNYWADEYALRTSWGQEFGSLYTSINAENLSGPEMSKLLGNLERLKLP